MSEQGVKQFQTRCKTFFDEINGGEPIKVTELNTVVQKVDPDFDGDIVAIFLELDDNMDKMVSWEEFSEEVCKMDPKKVTKSTLKSTFAEFDKDGSGKLSKEEVSTVFKSLDMGLSDEQLDELMTMADTDGSGSVNFQEFINGWFNVDQ